MNDFYLIVVNLLSIWFKHNENYQFKTMRIIS